jgi:hypothetical protein
LNRAGNYWSAGGTDWFGVHGWEGSAAPRSAFFISYPNSVGGRRPIGWSIIVQH